MSLCDRLVADWADFTKWWSVRWAALGAIILPALNVIPPILPPQIKALFPPAVQAAIDGAWCVGFIVLRVWAQRHPNA